MDPVVLVPAGVLLIVAGVLLIAASTALAHERRPDDPTYRPRHLRRTVPDDGIDRALNDTRRALRRSPAPWAQTGRIPGTPTTPTMSHSDETPQEMTVPDLPDWVYKTFWTAVALALGYLTTVAAPNVGETWTPLLAAVWTPVLVALRSWVDKRTGQPA